MTYNGTRYAGAIAVVSFVIALFYFNIFFFLSSTFFFKYRPLKFSTFCWCLLSHQVYDVHTCLGGVAGAADVYRLSQALHYI